MPLNVVASIVGGEVALQVMEIKPVQLLKVQRPRLVTLLGMVMEVKPVQLEKASSLMVMTLFGRVTEVIVSQR